jgi:hypothetical protein
VQCEKCNENIDEGEERDFNGRMLCEDCYMDALSPAKACDPWAVHCAKSFSKGGAAPIQVSELQAKILQVLKETGGIEPDALLGNLKIKQAELDRELAALRHMEKLRAEMRDGRKVLCLW